MLLNIICFNVSWFGLVFWGESFIPVTFCWIAGHLYLCRNRIAEFKLIISITLVGTLVDSLFSMFNVLNFENQHIPFWLITLWAAFATTIPHGLNYLAQSKALQLIAGLVFPPMSYVAGASLSTIELGYGLFNTFLILSITWGPLMVLFFYLKEKIYLQEKKCA